MAAEGASQLVSVVTLLGAAIIAVPIFKRLSLGSVLGYLAAGLVIGPFGLKLFSDPQAIIHVAELGVVMFLFIIGLEMKPSYLWGLRRQIFGLGSMQVVVCAVLLTFVGMAFGYSWQISFVGGAGFVLTSTAIVMQVLSERGDIASPRGQRMVSILLFEDLIIVPLLAIVTFLAPTDPNHIADPQPIWQKIGIAGLSVTALVVVGIWVLNPIFRILAKTKIRELMTAAALFVVLGSALLMEEGGLSTAMGAFVAGGLLSESSFRHQLEADIEPFRGLLLGLFFLGVGMALDLNIVFDNWVLILSAVIAMMAVKSLCILLIAQLAKSSTSDAMDRAVVMAQGGEFAFVLYAASATQGVISAEIQANLTAIILVGIGRYGQIVNHILTMSGYHPTIIDLNEAQIEGAKKYGIKSYYGNATRPELLHNAGIETAELLIVAVDDKHQAIHIVELARSMNPNIKIIARAYDRVHVFELYKAGADKQVRETFDSALRSGRAALKMLGVEEEVADEICDYYFERDRHNVKLMAEVYDPNLELFKNEEMRKIALAEDQETMLEIQNILERAREKKEAGFFNSSL
ncbi:monovalent cation:proton antiporter-2 (CPA2) family protein [Glaesserella parasuis]|uniref:monovalent cation:proton antiporter-2 (CPA2) family protein n=1 Tax=Glaesserella parasuis TaxID=738 RepID=UPI002718A038|nr:monovalent cation:proton antiporter-2 (CPA2) family protein [Glaesserella parasuis]MDO9660023.1 monovalent cation:proton antiporter-2 (CPA2) family protein [Glaesserella parasuis]MDO9670721.1 monovalent cation:proton antiporter-2 (CPA2) family protein [Glaesserella parasuis]MDO9686801.1 monovalent cation:proton antiporter-2 (CPA2) family protein [Glaesserella parasuis]MDO9688842.1 monovalent cation:proton antiporter-2 (CPA2) family protein [Glaesserella parasuis]